MHFGADKRMIYKGASRSMPEIENSRVYWIQMICGDGAE
jgi:hypothetical protein